MLNNLVFIDTFHIDHERADRIKPSSKIRNPHLESAENWDFSVTVAVSQQTVGFNGGFENTRALVYEQFDSLNSRFNNAGVFNGIINFYIDSVFEFTDTLSSINNTGSDFMVQYYMSNQYDFVWGMYWPDPDFTVQLSWSPFDTCWGFCQGMTDILVHELSHARGALDIYWEHVSAENNGVNGVEYPFDSTIMGTMYYPDRWDEHAIHVINRNGASPRYPIYYLVNCFPDTIGVLVTDVNGTPLSDVNLHAYVAPTRSYDLIETSNIDYYTDSTGKFIFDFNPFQPGQSGFPPFITNCNILVTAQKGTHNAYGWMPLSVVQNSFFNDSTKPYFLNIVMDDIVTDVDEEPFLSNDYMLSQNYPNPFNPTTTISFSLPKRSNVLLEIININGRVVKVLANREFHMGNHILEWDGTNKRNANVASGLYYYRLISDDFVETKKMVLLR